MMAEPADRDRLEAERQKAAVARRKRELGAIHVAKARLGMGDAEYRLLLRRVTGKGSAAELGGAERHKVLEEMRRLGWPEPRRPRRLDEPQLRMIRGLWIELADRGVVRDRTDKALDAFVKRQTGIDRLAWLNPDKANAVIEALKAWAARSAPA